MKYLDYRDYKIKKDGDVYVAKRIENAADKTQMFMYTASKLEDLISMIDAGYEVKEAAAKNKVFSLAKFIYWAGANNMGFDKTMQDAKILRDLDGKPLPVLPDSLKAADKFVKDWMVDKDAWKPL